MDCFVLASPRVGAPRELGGQRVHRVLEFAVLNAAPDQAPLRRLFGGEFLAQQCKTQRTRVADETREEPCAARIGYEPELAEGLHEARRTRGDHQVARQRDVRAARFAAATPFTAAITGIGRFRSASTSGL